MNRSKKDIMTYQSKSTMTTHTVSSNTDTARIKLGESSKDSLGQFLGDVTVHVIAGVIGGLCGVDVEACAGAEVVCVVFALDAKATWGLSVFLCNSTWKDAIDA
jgi:hypothetical protein